MNITCEIISHSPDIKPGSIIMTYDKSPSVMYPGAHYCRGPWLVISTTSSGGVLVVKVTKEPAARHAHADIFIDGCGVCYIDTIQVVHLKDVHTVVIGYVSDDIVDIQSLCKQHLSLDK